MDKHTGGRFYPFVEHVFVEGKDMYTFTPTCVDKSNHSINVDESHSAV